MTRLSVNVNKLATLRNSRGKNLPDVAAFSRRILEYGAHGLTVHPRPDGRHIRVPDVWALLKIKNEWNQSAKTPIEYNIEGYPSNDFLTMIEQVHPDQATLVPDPPEALTSNAGWDLVQNESGLKEILGRLRSAGVRSSLFVDPARHDEKQRAALVRLKPDRIELYTEAFHDHFGKSDQTKVVDRYLNAAKHAHENGIGVNAGHDLNQENLGTLIRAIPWIDEVSIGHGLMCEALEQGMKTTISNYLKILADA